MAAPTPIGGAAAPVDDLVWAGKDGAQVVTVTGSRVALWPDATLTGTPIRVREKHTGPVTAVASTRHHLFTGGADAYVYMFALPEGTFSRSLVRAALPIRHVAVRPRHRAVAVAVVAETPDIRIVPLPAPPRDGAAAGTLSDPPRVLAGHARMPHALAWHHGGDLLASAGADGAIKFWYLPEPAAAAAPVAVPSNAVETSAVHTLPNAVARGDAGIPGADGAADGGEDAVARAPRTLAWRPDEGAVLAYVNAQNTVCLFHYPRGVTLKTLDREGRPNPTRPGMRHAAPLVQLAWGVTGRFLLLRDTEGQVTVFNPWQQEVVHRVPGTWSRMDYNAKRDTLLLVAQAGGQAALLQDVVASVQASATVALPSHVTDELPANGCPSLQAVVQTQHAQSVKQRSALKRLFDDVADVSDTDEGAHAAEKPDRGATTHAGAHEHEEGEGDDLEATDDDDDDGEADGNGDEQMAMADADFVVDDDGAGYVNPLESRAQQRAYTMQSRRRLLDDSGALDEDEDAEHGGRLRLRPGMRGSRSMAAPEFAWRDASQGPVQCGAYPPLARGGGLSGGLGLEALRPHAHGAAKHKNARFLCINLVGTIASIPGDSHAQVSVTFHDEAQRSFHLTDHDGYTMGALSPQGALLASEGTASTASTLFFRRAQDSWGRGGNWSVTMDAKESIVSIALTRRYAVAATDHFYLRLLTLSGIQTGIISLAGPPVTVAGAEEMLMVVYHGGRALGLGDGRDLSTHQRLQYTTYVMRHTGNTGTPAHCAAQGPLPLSSGSQLAWVGFVSGATTATPAPVTYDSRGVLRVMHAYPDPVWVPFLDTRQAVEAGLVGEQDRVLPVGLTAAGLMAAVGRGGQMMPEFPQPILHTLPARLPLLAMDTPAGSLEEKRLREQLVYDRARTPLFAPVPPPGAAAADDPAAQDLATEMALDKSCLLLIQAACKAEKIPRAYDLAGCLHGRRSLEGAVKIAMHHGFPLLAERIQRMIEQRAVTESERLEAEHPAGPAAHPMLAMPAVRRPAAPPPAPSVNSPSVNSPSRAAIPSSPLVKTTSTASPGLPMPLSPLTVAPPPSAAGAAATPEATAAAVKRRNPFAKPTPPAGGSPGSPSSIEAVPRRKNQTTLFTMRANLSAVVPPAAGSAASAAEPAAAAPEATMADDAPALRPEAKRRCL